MKMMNMMALSVRLSQSLSTVSICPVLVLVSANTRQDSSLQLVEHLVLAETWLILTQFVVSILHVILWFQMGGQPIRPAGGPNTRSSNQARNTQIPQQIPHQGLVGAPLTSSLSELL